MANFDAVDRMSRTLRGENPLPPKSPMVQMAEQLRATPGVAPQPEVPAFDVEVTQRAKDMAAQRAAAATSSAAPSVGTGPAKTFNPNPGVMDRAAAAMQGALDSPAGKLAQEVAGNKWVQRGMKVANAAGGAQLAMTPGELADGTLTQAHLDAMKRPWDPNMKPIDVTTPGGGKVTSSAREQNPLRVQEKNSGISDPGQLNLGFTLRGKGFDDPRRVDRDPSRQSLGASRDFTNELASVPANLPADLRQGVIYKTKDANGRTVYSGVNVGNNAQFVDGMGQTITPRGSVQVAGGGVTLGPNGSYAFTPSTGEMTPQALAQRQAQTTAALTNPDGSRWTARDNAIMAANLRDGIDPYRGTSRGVAQAAPQGGGAVGGQMYTPSDIASRLNDLTSPERIALRNLSLSTGQKSGETPQAHTTRMAGVQKQAETILGGYADVNKQTTDRLNSLNQLRGTELTAGATRHTADQNLRGTQLKEATERWKVEQAQAVAQRQREVLQQALKTGGTGGAQPDRLAAADALMAAGYSDQAKALVDMQAAEDARRAKATDNTREQLTAVFGDKETANQAYAYLNRATKGRFENLPEAERNAAVNEAVMRFNIVKGANSIKDAGLLQRLGIDRTTPAWNDLPSDSALRGAKLEGVGLGWTATVGEPRRKDWQMTLRDGRQMYIPEGALDQSTMKYLQEKIGAH